MDRLQQTKVVKMTNMEKQEFDVMEMDDKPKDFGVAVYYFPGNGGITCANASCGCSIVKNGISILFDDESILDSLSLYGVYYGCDAYDRRNGSMDPEEVSLFVQNHLMPRCKDSNGKFLNIVDICKNISKVTFFGLCHGTTEINNIICEFQKQLSAEGFSQKSLRHITACLFEVSFAPESKLTLCPSVQALSLADPHNSGKVAEAINQNYSSSFGGKLDGVFLNFEKRGFLFGNKLSAEYEEIFFDSIKIISSKLLNETAGGDEHLLRNLSRTKNWKIKYYEDKNLDCVSQMMFFSLASGVARSLHTHATNKVIRVDLPELHKSLESIKSKNFSPEELKDHSRSK